MMYELTYNNKIMRIQPLSWGVMSEAIDCCSMAIFRQLRAFKYKDKWYSKRVCQYWWERLCNMGLCEMKMQKRGWFAWKMYRLTVKPSDVMYLLTGIPF